MSPKLKVPSVPLHCPGFPKSSDFIALDCPQFGNRIGDSCPALPYVAQPIGDRIGDAIHAPLRRPTIQASSHSSSIVFQGAQRSQSESAPRYCGPAGRFKLSRRFADDQFWNRWAYGEKIYAAHAPYGSSPRFLASPSQLPDSDDLDENGPSFRHFTSVTGSNEPTHAGRERLKRGGGKDGVCWHIGGNVVAK